MNGFQRLLANKYYVDEIYSAGFIKPTLLLSRDVFWRAIDQWLIDGAVNGTASASQGFGALARRLQSGNVRSYAGWVLIGAVVLIGYMVIYSG
jgi:NADH-quinone oxidoreductase subunit L